MNKKPIIVVGWILLAVIFVSFFAVMLIATFSGEGIRPVKIVPGGKGGSWLPVEAIPILIAVLIVVGFWLRRVLTRRASSSSPNKTSQRFR